MFYTYMWLREDGTPYYVGKGSTANNVYASGDCIVCAKARAKKFQRKKNNERHQ